MGDAELRAFDALGKNTRLADLVSIARAVVTEAARGRRRAWQDPPRVSRLAKEAKLEATMTPFGDALAVLERGPRDDAERALACALYAHVLAELPPKGPDAEVQVAGDLLWLAANTPFDATALLDRALGDEALDLWEAVAACVRRVDQGGDAGPDALGPGEALVGATALALSPAAKDKAVALGAEVRDPKLAYVLAREHEGGGAPERLLGEITPAPRGPVLTAALALTGILFVMHAGRLLAKLALAYRRPAEVLLAGDGVRIRFRTELLGRTLRDRDVVVPRGGLVRATREVRYPRAAFYAGLLALAVGSYFGVSTLVDGVRAASPSLLLTGLVFVILGIALDFALASIAPSAKGRCRLLFVPKDGPKLCVAEVETTRADAVLGRLAQMAQR